MAGEITRKERNLLQLYLTKGVGSKFLKEFYKVVGTFEGNLKELLERFFEVRSLKRDKLNTFLERLQESEKQLEDVLKDLNRYGVQIVPFYSDRFPKALNLLEDIALLFTVGRFEFERGFAIVGTRKASSEGRKKAFEFARSLSEKGFLIVSGGAYGIDRVAHEGALSVGGRTAVVLGEGILTALKRGEKLFNEVLQKEGFLISQFPPNFGATKWSFPKRNALIAALSPFGTLIVEAPERSGALITAEYTLQLERNLFVYLGCTHNTNYRGNVNLIASCKGRLVIEPLQLLELLNAPAKGFLNSETLKKVVKTETEKGSEYENGNPILGYLREKPRTFDELLALTQMSETDLTNLLTELELEGKITFEGGYYKL